MTQRIEIGDSALLPDGLLITPGGERQLSPRLSIVLRALVDASGTAVRRDDLLDAVWGAGSGSYPNLSKAVFDLRDALAGSRAVQIESVYGYGYRLHYSRSGPKRPNQRDRAKAICAEAAHRVYDHRSLALQAALSLYAAAAQLDPGCIEAYDGFVETTMQLLVTGQARTKPTWEAAQQALEEAGLHTPGSPTLLAQRGAGQCLYAWDFTAASESIGKALQADPGGYRVNQCAGRYLLFLGRAKEAAAHLRVAHAANPLAMNTAGLLAYALGCSGDIDGARRQAAEARHVGPGNLMSQTYFGWVEATWGDAEEACAVCAEAHRHAETSATLAAVRAFALARAGREPDARRLACTLQDRSVYATSCGAVASLTWQVLGEPQLAIDALATAADERDYWLGAMLNDPGNAPLRGIPEFDAVYRRVFGDA